jgi:hypothetical protein
MDKEFVLKTMQWFSDAYAAITAAGGSPEYIISQIPEPLLETLIRNNLRLEHVKYNP